MNSTRLLETTAMWLPGSLQNAGREACRLEEAGYDGVWAAETSHDPFPTATLAAAATTSGDVGTGIAVTSNAYSPFEADDALWAQVREGFSAHDDAVRAR